MDTLFTCAKLVTDVVVVREIYPWMIDTTLTEKSVSFTRIFFVITVSIWGY